MKHGKSVQHVVRTADGKTKLFKKYGRKLAMAIFCSECMGWGDNPNTCTAPLCPLFPYRIGTLATRKGD